MIKDFRKGALDFFKGPFPPFFYLFASLLTATALFVLWSSFVPEAALVYSWRAAFAVLGLYGFSALWTMIKELKRADKEGVKKALGALGLIWAAANYALAESPVAFSLLALWLVLLYQSFYLPLGENNNFLLRLLNSLSVFFAVFYALGVFSADQGIQVFSLKNALLALALWASFFAWEVSGDASSGEREMAGEFPSFSKLFGFQGSAFLALTSSLLQLASLIRLSTDSVYGAVFAAGSATLFGIYVMVLAKAIIRPLSSKAQNLQRMTGSYILFSFTLALVCAVAEIVR